MSAETISQIALKAAEAKEGEEVALWTHLKIDSAADAASVKEAAPFLDDLAISALCADDTRPRVSSHGDEIILILRAVNMNPGEEPDDMVSVRIWSDGISVVSVVRRRVFAAAKLVTQLEKKPASMTAHEIVVRLMTNVIENMREPLGNFYDIIDGMELDSFADDPTEQQVRLKRVRHSILQFRRYMAPMRTAVSELEEMAEDWGETKLVRQIRQAEDTMIRHVEDLDMVRERLQYQQEAILTAMTDKLNRNMYRLSVVAAIFLPLGFLTGLLGINVGGMPGADMASAFWWVVGGCGLIAGGQYLYFKRGGWF
jgi:zinc transporter